MARPIFVGLDIGVEETCLCVIDGMGAIVQQTACGSTARAIHHEIRWVRRRRLASVAMEAGGIAIARGLRTLGYKVEIYENRQLSKFLRVRRNKTDSDDARGIAEASRLGQHTLSKVHLKSLECQALQSRLVFRRHVIRERVAAVNLLCRQIELYGGRINRHDAIAHLSVRAEAEISRLFPRQKNPLADDFMRLLAHCERLLERQEFYDQGLRRLARDNQTCRLLMQIPGVGPICALTFYAAIDDPARFRRVQEIGSYLGLAPRLKESGSTSRRPRISKMGNGALRSLLVRAATSFMKSKDRDPVLYDWALGVEARSGRLPARVALARKLSILMLTMWKNNQPYHHRADMPLPE
jgi:transposase